MSAELPSWSVTLGSVSGLRRADATVAASPFSAAGRNISADAEVVGREAGAIFGNAALRLPVVALLLVAWALRLHRLKYGLGFGGRTGGGETRERAPPANKCKDRCETKIFCCCCF